MTELHAPLPPPEPDQTPSRASTGGQLPRAPLGTAAWEVEWKAIEAARESSKVYQLGFWPDDKRAMPGDFIACALFSCLQGKDSEYVERQTLAAINGLSVTFTGRRLTQVHADVWEAIMHLSRQRPEGSLVRFSARQLLRLTGRQTGGKQRDDLDLWINQLTATSVTIHDEKNHQRFRGSLLPRSAEKTDDDDTLYSVDINRDLAKVLSANEKLFLVDWEKRRRLQQKPLAAWLQRHFSRFHKPIAVAELYRLSGSTTKRLVDFRKLLRAALADLQTVGVLAAWRIDEATDTVHVTLEHRRVAGGTSTPGTITQTSHLPAPIQGALPLPLGPHVGANARTKFRDLYPGKDVERCLADFGAWLHKTGKTADKPDAAFLGFASKWASSS